MSNGDHLTADRGAIRFLLLALGVPQALIGLWALFAPQSFYDDFPAGTDGWVHVLGPFDEHLVTDVGSLFVALGVVLAFAAFSLRRGDGRGGRHGLARLRRAALPLARVQPRARTRPRTRSRTPSRSAGPWPAACSSCSWRCGAASAAPRAAAAGDGGARIAPVQRRPRRAARARRLPVLAARLGAVTEPLRVFAHHPRVLSGYAGLEYATAKADRVPHRLKALAATKAAALAGLRVLHGHRLHDLGQGRRDRGAAARAPRSYSTSDLFSEDEKLVLDLAVGMTPHPRGRVRRAVRAPARALRRGPARGARQRDRRGELPRPLRLGLRHRLAGLRRGRVLRAPGAAAAGRRAAGRLTA